MIDFKNKVFKTSKSYEIACKCARTSEIYSASVLEANKFNLNFLHHLRSLEINVCKNEIVKAVVSTENIGACTFDIFNTSMTDVLKIRSNGCLDEAIEALDCELFSKRTFARSNGETTYIYEVKFNLTL